MTDITPLTAALHYAEQGWPVFPVHTAGPNGICSCGKLDCTSPAKHPLTGHGLLDATTDELQIHRWWKENPEANVAIQTGSASGLVVIDIDPRHGGIATWGVLQDKHHPEPTLEALTGGGGSHLLFRYPGAGPVRSGSNVLGQGIDVRADGGYIVAPPSVHISGRRYSWDPAIPQPIELPDWLVAALQAPQGTGAVLDMGAVMAGVPAGKRDVELFRAAAKLRWAGVPYDDAVAVVLQAAGRCSPPFPEREAIAKVQSAYGRYIPSLADPETGDRVQMLEWDHVQVTASSPIGPIELDFADMERGNRDLDTELTIRILTPGVSPEPYRQRINILSQSSREAMRRELDGIYGKEAKWTGLLSRTFVKAHDAFALVDRATPLREIASPAVVPYVVDGLIPATGPTILFGASASAKTYLALDLAVSIALGRAWIGRAAQRRNVLYVDYETGDAIFGYRTRRLIDNCDPPIFYWAARGIPLHEQIPALKQAIQRHQIGLIIVDHAAACCGGEPEKSDSALRVQRTLERLAVPSLLVAHITGAGEANPSQVLRPFGSYFWHGMARSTWYVQREQGKQSDKAELGIYSRKASDDSLAADFGVNIFFGEAGGPVRIVAGDLQSNPTLSATRGPQYTIWDALAGGSLTVTEIAELVPGGEAAIRMALGRHPGMFVQISAGGGRGNPAVWGRVG